MKPCGYDLHVHGIHSDGLYSPLQLLEMARRAGLAGIAITDHDHLPCCDAMQVANASAGPRWLVGVELSCKFGERGVHLLGYNFDPTNAALRQLVQAIQSARRDRFARMLESLQKVVQFRDKVDSMQRSPSPGRRHLARALVELRKASGIRAAFDRYLKPLGDTVDFERPTLRQAVDVLHAAGGQACLAHPPGNFDDGAWQAVRQAGVDAIETSFPSANGNRRRRLQEVALQHGFATSAGSDFHGDAPADFIGRFWVETPAFMSSHGTRQ